MTPEGFRFYPAYMHPDVQESLVAAVFAAAKAAPFYRPRTPSGQAMSVMMTNFGPLGWVTDDTGYRYEPRHPLTGLAWPPIPAALLQMWGELTDCGAAPDACLVNLYGPTSRMGLHQDRDERDFSYPVVSVSLGDEAVFRIGMARRGPTVSMRLKSGDVCMMAGPARLAFHGVDRILPGRSTLIPGGGRLNLTLRRAR